MKYTEKELKDILSKHLLYLEGDINGKMANLRGVNLRGEDLRGADLRGADLRGADLRGANISIANLRGADLRGVNLRGANLISADLRGADLRGADLISADLRGVNLRGANLRGAILDYSCFPLWCGGSGFKTDMKFINQMLAHICTLDVEEKEEFEIIKSKIIENAKKSHRAIYLGLI